MYSGFHECPQDVNELFAETERRNFQFGTGWYEHLATSVLAAHGEVRIYVVRSALRVMAALPVLIRTRGEYGSSSVESLSNFYTSLFEPALRCDVSGAELSLLFAAIAEAHRPVATFRFAPMDPDSPAFARVEEGLRLAGMKPFRFFCFGNWYLKVACDWAGYLGSREGVLRTTLKRMGKRFSHAGGSLEVITCGERLEAGLKAYEQVYGVSWKSAEPYQDFVPGLMRLCADRGWLRLAVAWLGEKPVAAQIWIVAYGRAEIYKLAYDEDFKKYSPGSLLTELLMRQAFEKERVDEVDYLIGDDPYKKAWMGTRRERWGVIAYNPATIAGRVGSWQERLGRAVKPLRRVLRDRDHHHVAV